jgi:putative oxidoreductase
MKALVASQRKTFVEIISALLILLFTYTAISKLIGFEDFKYFLKQSPLIGESRVNFVSIALPAFELFISLLLFIPKQRMRGLWLSFITMTFFTIYIAYMLLYVPNLPCSCGGVLQNMTWTQHLYFNIFFTGLPAAAIWLMRRPQKPDPELSGHVKAMA